MSVDANIDICEVGEKKPRPADDELGFGTIFTDHMFVMEYDEDTGWHDHRIIPYGPLSFEPSSAFFHYGQTAFEGLKAYSADDGRTLLFRPWENARRMNATGERLCIPPIDEELFVRAIEELVALDRDWVPSAPGTSLYIRPFILATERYLGLKPSSSYTFAIIMSPVGTYHGRGNDPTKIYVETEHVRSIAGGVGAAKAGGNYARCLKAEVRAARKGFHQVLWLDGQEKKYVEEVGTMNVFFRIDDVVVTPPLQGTIMPGVTRDSVLTLLEDWGVKAQERRLSLTEIADAHRAGSLQEAFGTGTAAVITPIGQLQWDDLTMEINDGRTGDITGRVHETITGIQSGKVVDRFGWTTEVPD